MSNPRRRNHQPELKPVYVAQVLERHEREAYRAFFQAAFCGPRAQAAGRPYDPLWLRVGMRACFVQNRAGGVVSNPGLAEMLLRRPDMDESLPGPAWLREVYRYKHRALVALPSARAAMDARLAALRLKEMPPAAPAPIPETAVEPQLGLFA